MAESYNNNQQNDSVYSEKVKAGKRRTYFFDVRQTRGDDYYVTITESTKRMDGGFERHKIFLYKEDFNRFLAGLQDSIEHVKTNLMPDFDYEEFDRRQEEYEARMREEQLNDGQTPENYHTKPQEIPTIVPRPADKIDDDMAW